MAYLPIPLITYILSRLPVKSLLSFRCVSKSWQSIIDDKHFINLHLNNSIKNCTNQVLILFKDSKCYTLDFPTLTPITKIDHPLQGKSGSLDYGIVGPCIGLLALLSTQNELHTLICNPATKQYREVLIPSIADELPFSGLHIQTMEERVAYGFGYDQFNDDYKLVTIFQSGHLYSNEYYSVVHVYSLKTNSWKSVVNLPREYVLGHERDIGYYAFGQIHWVFTRKSDKNYLLFVALDTGLEEFKVVELPTDYRLHNKSSGGYCFNFAVLGGCLCVVSNCPSVGTELWVMKESWTKLLVISGSDYLRPIAYSKDNSKVLIELNNSKFFWFDLHSQSAVSVKIHGLPSLFCFEMLVESLVPLGNHQKKLPKKKSDKLDGFLAKGFKLKL